MMKPQHAFLLLLTILASETAFARRVKDVMWTADTPEDVKTLLQEVQRQDRALFDGFVGQALSIAFSSGEPMHIHKLWLFVDVIEREPRIEGGDGSYVQRTFAGAYGDPTIYNRIDWREQSEFERVEDAVESAWWSYSVPRKDFMGE